MKVYRILLLVLCLSLGELNGQERGKGTQSPEQLVAVEISARIKTPLQWAIFTRTRCDSDGNVYVRRFLHSTPPELYETPVQKLEPDGTVSTVFQFHNLSDGSETLMAKDFTVTPDGEVYEIAFTEKRDLYVLSFSSNGSEKSQTHLETEGFRPFQLAVFKSGEYLVTGETSWPDIAPVTAIFSASGELLKKVSQAPPTRQNELGEKNQDKNIPKSESAGDSGSGNKPLERGEIVSGADGNVYMLRAESAALVYAISPAGEIIRQFRIDSGRDGWFPQSMKAFRGGLAIAFGKGQIGQSQDHEIIVKTVTYSGDPIAGYISSDNRIFSSALTCYTPSGLLFVNVATDGFVYLQVASPK